MVTQAQVDAMKDTADAAVAALAAYKTAWLAKIASKAVLDAATLAASRAHQQFHMVGAVGCDSAVLSAMSALTGNIPTDGLVDPDWGDSGAATDLCDLYTTYFGERTTIQNLYAARLAADTELTAATADDTSKTTAFASAFTALNTAVSAAVVAYNVLHGAITSE